jgi:hypothetical protein
LDETLKSIVSSESLDVPDGHPVMERLAEISASGGISSRCMEAPMTISLPPTPKPPTASLMDLVKESL